MEHMWRGHERGQGCTGLGSPRRLAFWISLDLLLPVLLALGHQPETLCWQMPLSLLEASLPLAPGLQPAVLLAVPQSLVGPLLAAGKAADPWLRAPAAPCAPCRSKLP